jgi:heptosyltransferase-3
MVVDPPHGPPHAHPGGDQSLRVVRRIGVDTEDTRPRLYLETGTVSRVRGLLVENGIDPKGRFVTINPFSRWKYKEWGYGKWVEVLDAIRERYALPAVIVGDGKEAETADRIADQCGGSVRNMAGKTTLGELAALLSGSSLHLGVDSAAPHIACAVGTPTVTVFGPSDWRAWTVEDDLHRAVTPDMACVPCHKKGCDGKERSICLEELAVGEVMNAVDKVLPAALARPGFSAI